MRSRALQLDEHAVAVLHSLSARRPAGGRGAEPERAAEHVERLIGSWSHTPAFVHDQFMDVLQPTPSWGGYPGCAAGREPDPSHVSGA
jgi:hypothetical protein